MVLQSEQVLIMAAPSFSMVVRLRSWEFRAPWIIWVAVLIWLEFISNLILEEEEQEDQLTKSL